MESYLRADDLLLSAQQNPGARAARAAPQLEVPMKIAALRLPVLALGAAAIVSFASFSPTDARAANSSDCDARRSWARLARRPRPCLARSSSLRMARWPLCLAPWLSVLGRTWRRRTGPDRRRRRGGSCWDLRLQLLRLLVRLSLRLPELRVLLWAVLWLFIRVRRSVL